MRMDTQRASYKHPPRLPVKSTATPFRLTPRECETAYWIGYAYCNKDIATLMGIGINGVKTNLFNIAQKTGMSSRLELLRWVWDKGYCAL